MNVVLGVTAMYRAFAAGNMQVRLWTINCTSSTEQYIRTNMYKVLPSWPGPPQVPG